MTNFEKNKDWFDEHELEFRYCARAFGVNKDGEVELCHDITCADCIFREGYCPENRAKWLKAEAEEETIDWSKVPIDTPIEVEKPDGSWVKRYFAKYLCGRVYAWDDGLKSDKSRSVCTWEHARICKEDE